MDKEKKAIRNALLLEYGRKGIDRLVTEYRTRTNWTVSVSSEDDLYYSVHAWLMKQEDSHSPRRAVTVKSQFEYVPTGTHKQRLDVVFDGNSDNVVSIGGHDVVASIENAGGPLSNDPDSVIQSVVRPPKLIFRAKSRAGRDAVVELMRQLHAAKWSQKHKPALNIYTKFGEWQRRSDLPARTLDSVIVKGDVVNELHRDLLDFKEREPEYNRRGIPYHRAYLLTGPPGCGKTSSVKAVTQALGLDLWYAQLSELEKDAKLVDMLSDVRAGGILLLEDIDSFSAATARGDERNKVSASGLLNALDGVATPHGLVTILTTNHPEKLDPALVRPGRIDRILEFENPDSETIHRHFEFFYGHKAKYRGKWPVGTSSAAVSEVFKRNMDNSQAAETELLKGL
jgi:hypothetical protein